MVYQTPDDRLADRLATYEDTTVVVGDSGNNAGMALLAGVLIVVAIVLLVWLLGGSAIDPSGTTFSPVETTLPVENTGVLPTAPG